MREPKNQMLGTMEPPLMQLSVNVTSNAFTIANSQIKKAKSSVV